MSYVRKIEYRIEPEESFKIIGNCTGCGCKSLFQNTNHFRVNANGNKVDVWLIYQCVKCKHTSNLTIYERCRPDTLERKEYESYLSNSYALKVRTDKILSELFDISRTKVRELEKLDMVEIAEEKQEHRIGILIKKDFFTII